MGCLGPLGRPFEPVSPPAEAWMVAGGVGLAPFVTLAEALQTRGTKARLFYGARTARDLTHVELFEQLNAEPILATEDGSRGTQGFVTAPLDAAFSDTPRSTEVRVYACGPTPMMRAVARLAASYGRRCDVSLEQVMGCGLGGLVSLPFGGSIRSSCEPGPALLNSLRTAGCCASFPRARSTGRRSRLPSRSCNGGSRRWPTDRLPASGAGRCWRTIDATLGFTASSSWRMTLPARPTQAVVSESGSPPSGTDTAVCGGSSKRRFGREHADEPRRHGVTRCAD